MNVDTAKCLDRLVVRGIEDLGNPLDFIHVTRGVARATTEAEYRRLERELPHRILDLALEGALVEPGDVDGQFRPWPAIDEGRVKRMHHAIEDAFDRKRAEDPHEWFWFRNTKHGAERAAAVLAQPKSPAP